METEQNINPQQTEEVASDNGLQQQNIEELRLEQNLPFAIFAGLGSALVMAFLWAMITVVTMYQIGYMAIAVGFAVGFSVRFAGKGIDKIFGVIGAIFALLGCVLGNFFSQIAFIADYFEATYAEILSMFFAEPSAITGIMVESFHPMDALFYGIAIYAGYQFSFRELKKDNSIEN